MNLQQFKDTLQAASPPQGVNKYLKALWYDAKGNWENAHDIIQNIEGKTGSRIHAYLHRKEGDIFNANYWYNKAQLRMPGYSLEQEWEEIVAELIA